MVDIMTGCFFFSLEYLVESSTQCITQRTGLEFIFHPLFEIVVRNYGMTIQIKSFTSITVQCQMYITNNIIRARIAPNITINSIEIQSNDAGTIKMNRTVKQWRLCSGQLWARTPFTFVTLSIQRITLMLIISPWARAEITL